MITLRFLLFVWDMKVFIKPPNGDECDTETSRWIVDNQCLDLQDSL